MARPGGTIHPFWEPVTTTSMPHSSTGQGSDPRLETASTMSSLSRCLTTCAISPMGLVTPVEVSLWVIRTDVTSGLASRDAATDSAVAACPHSTRCQRTSAPNVLCHPSQTYAESSYFNGENGFSGGEGIDDGRFKSAGAGGREHKDIVLCFE